MPETYTVFFGIVLTFFLFSHKLQVRCKTSAFSDQMHNSDIFMCELTRVIWKKLTKANVEKLSSAQMNQNAILCFLNCLKCVSHTIGVVVFVFLNTKKQNIVQCEKKKKTIKTFFFFCGLTHKY